MAKLPVPSELKKQVATYLKQHNEARELTNAANREKTALRNAIKDHWLEAELPIGSSIRIGGIEFLYEANDTTVIDVEALLTAFEAGDISRKQLLDMIKATSSDVSRVMGADFAADNTITQPGTKVDVRMNSLPVENQKDEYILIKRKERPTIRRKTNKAKPQKTAAKGRRIKLRR